ncbi:MAG: hypothetical protein JWM11_6139, partial [Planctomycetaceae bacterium]|nr:hypothetical protein [Planctomycetaceae bacterium]
MFRNSQCIGFCVLLAALVGRIETASAQMKSVPINVVHGGIDRLYEDLDYVFGLADDPKNLKTLKETLDVFFVGMDTKKPAVIQVYVRKGKFNLVLHAPTVQPGGAKRFRDNVRALGLKPQQMGGGIFAVRGLFNGFMKEVIGADSTTIIAEDRADLVSLGALLAYKTKLDPKDYDFVASIVNTADLLKDREAAVELVRTQMMPGLKKLKVETDAQFELRKLTIDQQITEIKQIYSEAELISGFGNISKKDKHAIFETEMKALPETTLAKGMALLGKDPSYFANIPVNNTEPLSGMINFKLDAMRQKHLQNFLKQARPLVHKEIEEADMTTAESKEHGRIINDIVFDVMEQSTADGILDGIVNVTVNESKLHTIVGGVKGDGAVVLKGLKVLKQKAHVDMDVEKIGDVAIHKLTLPNDMKELHEIFGKDLVLIIGTGPKAIWYAMGEGAEA